MRGTHTSLLALLLVLLLPVARTALQSSSGAAAAEQVQGPRDDSTPSKHKPNIVLIIVDDQDAVQDSISTMKAVQRLLVQEGTSFERFFAPVSLCCPSRTSFLRAQAAHNTNITSVIAPWGGWGVFCEKGYNSHYLPSFMQSAGYSTRYVGKLMNGHNVNNYEALAPAGFTDADFLLDPQTYNYVNASFGRVGSPVQYHAGSYSTDLVKEKALHMIRDASHQRKPFFVVIAPIAPHSHIASLSHDVRLEAPVSAPRHAHLFKDVTLNYSRASHNPSSPSGASWVRQLERLNQTHVAYIEEFYRQRLRSLQAVDELVEAVVNELNKHNKSDDTIIIYTSDNGFEANGGHRRNPGKTLPYEEDIRIPFVVRGPGVPKGVVDSKSVYSLADLGATIMHLAGAKSDYEHDGSLVPLTKALRQDAVREGIKQHHLAEYWVDGIEEGKYSGQSERCAHTVDPGKLNYPDNVSAGRSFLNTTYRAIRIVEGNLTDLSYAVWCTGEHEIYDLRTDPDQMHNLAEVQSQSPELQKLLTRLDALLLVLKTCVGEVCKRPWKEMFPREDIRSLKDALDVKYDQYFRQLPKVTYSRCELGYFRELEHPFWSRNLAFPHKGSHKLSTQATEKLIQPTSIHRSHGMEHIWLPDGHRIPEIGYGSWLIGSGSTVVDQVEQALETGSNHLELVQGSLAGHADQEGRRGLELWSARGRCGGTWDRLAPPTPARSRSVIG
ncbi:BQ5605_C009g05404 [Microbotryum silenes-dioicae]|uniref:BQ5605_C009g05404 protein n=1 Tax=Microbotryum silenes-dioicae TaxID=796604 RepID=A0A2X0MDA8_9BASI|nr:BQ5605_C009g05404 [Microbotryum silenes-dioicae]